MAVTVRLFAAARAAAGTSETQVQPGTLGEIHEELISVHSKLSEVLPLCSYLVDETACNDKDVQVLDGSTVDVLPPFAGG